MDLYFSISNDIVSTIIYDKRDGFDFLRRQLSSGGGEPVQFSAFGWEIPCETTTTQKVTIKPLIHTTAGTILIIVLLIDIFASDASKNRKCVAEVSS